MQFTVVYLSVTQRPNVLKMPIRDKPTEMPCVSASKEVLRRVVTLCEPGRMTKDDPWEPSIDNLQLARDLIQHARVAFDKLWSDVHVRNNTLRDIVGQLPEAPKATIMNLRASIDEAEKADLNALRLIGEWLRHADRCLFNEHGNRSPGTK